MRCVPKVKEQQTTRKGESEKRFWLGINLKKRIEKQTAAGKQETLDTEKPEITPDTTVTTHYSTSKKVEEKNVIKKEGETPVVSVVSVVNYDSILTQERIVATYQLIKKKLCEYEGPVPIEDIPDKPALAALFKDGKVFDSNVKGHIGVA